MNYIYNVDGFDGCYRGLIPRLACSTLYIFAHSTVAQNIKSLKEPDILELNEEELTETEK